MVIDGDTATLADIVIDDRAPNTCRLLNFLCPRLFTSNYRGKGLGTLLLGAVCEHFRSAGFTRIDGEMAGDIDRLTVWYEKAGFTVDRASKKITRDLM
jgi:GNAT superfamily N-acetyltransferase